jgi:Short C-terminal domain
MAKLTPEGEKVVAGLAEQYKIGADAVKMMLDAVARGGGTMAQFNVPEFGGSGQWMRGGMTMIGDMFNNSMKATVDNLCTELSNLMQAQANLYAPAMQSQSQSQSSGSATSFTKPSWSYNWWPEELGNPSSTGAQNALRYAYFPEIRRLAIEFDGKVEVYDTTGFDIHGFSQQQGGDIASLTFTSNRGPVGLRRLPRVHSLSGEARKPAEASAPEPPEAKAAAQAKSAKPAAQAKSAPEKQPEKQPGKQGAEAPAASSHASGDASSVLALIEQLSGLKEKGILTEEEFAAKKAELLKRL